METNTSLHNYFKYKIQRSKKIIFKICSEQFKNDATIYYILQLYTTDSLHIQRHKQVENESMQKLDYFSMKMATK